MAASGFDRENILGRKLTKMDRQELCAFISDLCRTVVAEVGSRGRRGGIYPDNISVDAKGAIALGPAGRSPWDGQELNFVAPEQYWNGPLSAAERLLAICKTLEGHPNKDLLRYTKEISKLADHMEN